MIGVRIAGAAQTAFGRTPDRTGRDHAVQAIGEALADAGLGWSDVDAAFGGSDAAGNADTLVAELGQTGIPFINVKNGCATGGSALICAVNAIRAGSAEVVLAVGFDKHPRGAFDPRPEDWGLSEAFGAEGLMVTTQFFGMKIKKYMADHRITDRTLALVAEKAFANGAKNPLAWRRDPLSAEDILSSEMVNDPLTKLMFCSPGEGAAAIVLISEARARSLARQTVALLAAELRTRPTNSFEVFSPGLAAGPVESVSELCARATFASAGVTPQDIDVIQVQDTESGAEVMHLAECGFCEHGDQEKLIAEGATRIEGRMPVNTDGGCLANGEPIGASGLRQVGEVVRQLRGEAGERQVAGSPRLGFTHVYGAPGISACTVLSV